MFYKSLGTAFVACGILLSGVSGGRFSELSRRGPRAAEKFVRDHQNTKRATDASAYRFLNNKTAG